MMDDQAENALPDVAVEQATRSSPRTATERRDAAPLTMLDIILIVIAAGFSAGMSVKAQKPIPLLHFPHAWNLRLPKPLEFDGEALVYGFAGLLGVGPIIQGLQFLRFGRRRWSAVEWAWTAAGACFAALPILDEWLPFRWHIPVEQVFDWFVGLFYWGTGPVALMCVLPSIFRHRNLPWSGWIGLLVTVSWSILWWAALFF